MNIKKKEKIALQVLLLTAIFAVILSLLLLPAMEEKALASADLDLASLELEEKQELMADTGLDERHKEAMEEAEKNYNYFYSVLNSYTIDTIINTLVQKHDMSISMLNIGEYEDATYDFPKLEEEELKVLVKSTVNLTISGNYTNMIRFMDALNQKSTGLRVDMLSIYENTMDATGRHGMTASFRIYIYGVDVQIESLQKELGIDSHEAAAE